MEKALISFFILSAWRHKAQSLSSGENPLAWREQGITVSFLLASKGIAVEVCVGGVQWKREHVLLNSRL